MSEQESKTSIYPIADPEQATDPIYNDLSTIVRVYTIEKFREHIINRAVLLLDTKEDLVNFSIKTIDDEIDLLKDYNKDKKFVVFTQEMIAKVAQDQEFYTIIIQPYLFVQLKNKRDEFVSTFQKKDDEANEGDSEDPPQENE